MTSTGSGCCRADRALDLGCGAGRHAFEMYRRGADVVALDQDADELDKVREWFAAMREAGEIPEGAEADVKEGDALALPFADGEFDRVVAAEILEHVPADIQAIEELVRVTRPGGTVALTVPRWFPEIVCWRLSRAYHDTPGGHIRIYTDAASSPRSPRTPASSSPARATPTACTRRTGGSSAPSAWTTTATGPAITPKREDWLRFERLWTHTRVVIRWSRRTGIFSH